MRQVVNVNDHVKNASRNGDTFEVKIPNIETATKNDEELPARVASRRRRRKMNEA